MEIIEAIEKLKDSHALICLENRALIKMEKDKAVVDADTCIDCGACVSECPMEAISQE